MNGSITWYAPKTLEEARNRREQAVEAVQKLQILIGDSQHRPKRRQYMEQLRVLNGEARRLKDWIAEFHVKEDRAPNGVGGMLVEAVKLFDKLKSEDVDFDPDEVALVERMRGWCLAKGLAL